MGPVTQAARELTGPPYGNIGRYDQCLADAG